MNSTTAEKAYEGDEENGQSVIKKNREKPG